ncbi:hypothetical protein E2C04_09665 [Nocardioides daphniae]|uniref:Histidine kinase/HSP90-like ATPase domain-containing protein n=1 Tax=Nocardioides daphniae TaxID=402297 RepID=A0A4V1CWW8_9ACTN|nr:hypothetical protein E2C04_09665 [Nocardioides daphniae]
MTARTSVRARERRRRVLAACAQRRCGCRRLCTSLCSPSSGCWSLMHQTGRGRGPGGQPPCWVWPHCLSSRTSSVCGQPGIAARPSWLVVDYCSHARVAGAAHPECRRHLPGLRAVLHLHAPARHHPRSGGCHPCRGCRGHCVRDPPRLRRRGCRRPGPRCRCGCRHRTWLRCLNSGRHPPPGSDRRAHAHARSARRGRTRSRRRGRAGAARARDPRHRVPVVIEHRHVAPCGTTRGNRHRQGPRTGRTGPRGRRGALAETRNFIHALAPPSLRVGGIADALQRLGATTQQTSGLRTRVDVSGYVGDLPTPVETALLRIAQSAVANVVQHARAARVDVTLSRLDDEVILDVVDDGVGFDLAALSRSSRTDQQSFGLVAMQDRAVALGGRLVVESGRGQGTSVAASFTVHPGKGLDKGLAQEHRFDHGGTR